MTNEQLGRLLVSQCLTTMHPQKNSDEALWGHGPWARGGSGLLGAGFHLLGCGSQFRRITAPLFDWMMAALSYQGISDQGFDGEQTWAASGSPETAT